ncbi:hypothetical protein CRG98_004601, partial [Punica granatum]
MQCKLSLSVARLKWAPSAHPRGCFKTGHSAKNLSQHSSRFKLVGQAPGDRWKLSDIDANAVQEQVNLWLSKTQNFLSEVTIRLVKSGHGRKPDAEDASTTRDELEIFMAEQTVNRRTPNGILSLEAVLAIEQFG